MTRALGLALAAMLLPAGCDGPGGPSSEAAPAEARGDPRPAGGADVLKSETVEAVFTGWDKGDYVWARLEVKGRGEFGVWSGPSPIDLFLDSHIGKPLTLTLEPIVADVPEAGGKLEIQRISAARTGALTADQWWRSLSPKQRQDAQIGLAGSLEPEPPAER